MHVAEPVALAAPASEGDAFRAIAHACLRHYRLNEIVWRTQTTDFWVNFKLFGVVPLTFLFGALQYPLLTKHAASEPAAEDL